MWVVADLDDEYIARMEDVLEVYERPYDPQQPVICLDEKPVTLHADVRPASPAVPGREARRDNEYERLRNCQCFLRRRAKGRAAFHLSHTRPFRLRVRPGGGRAGTGIPGSEDYSSSNGQPEHPSPESSGGRRRCGNGGTSLGSVHRALHADPRQLAESSGD